VPDANRQIIDKTSQKVDGGAEKSFDMMNYRRQNVFCKNNKEGVTK